MLQGSPVLDIKQKVLIESIGHFQQYFSYIMAASAPIHAVLAFF